MHLLTDLDETKMINNFATRLLEGLHSNFLKYSRDQRPHILSIFQVHKHL